MAARKFKQAQFIRIDGTIWVLGLEWHIVKDVSVRHCRQLAKKSRGSYGTFCYPKKLGSLDGEDRTIEESTPLPLFGVVANGGRGRRARSAAVLVGQSYEQAIVVLRIEEGAYWLCAVVKGMVILDKDVASDEDEIKKMATELLELNPDFVCVGDDVFWSSLDWSNLGVDPSPVKKMDVDTFFELDDSSNIPVLAHYGGHRWLWVSLTMMGACVAGIAAHQAYQQWLAPDPVVVQIKQDPAEVAMDSHNATVTRVVQEQGLHRSNITWTQRVLALVDRTPVSINGWQLEAVKCEFVSDQCLLKWSSKIGTYADFLQARGRDSQTTFTGPKQAQEVLSLLIKESVLKPLQDRGILRQYLSLLPSTHHFEIQDVSKLQEFDSLDVITSFGLNAQPAKSYLSPAPVPTRQTLGSLVVGDWHLNGKGLGILLGSIQLLNSSVFHVQSLTLTLKADGTNQSSSSALSVQWKLAGHYTTLGDN